jgi:hypothetical protein
MSLGSRNFQMFLAVHSFTVYLKKILNVLLIKTVKLYFKFPGKS